MESSWNSLRLSRGREAQKEGLTWRYSRRPPKVRARPSLAEPGFDLCRPFVFLVVIRIRDSNHGAVMSDIKHMIEIAAPREVVWRLVSSGRGFSEWWASDVVVPSGKPEIA